MKNVRGENERENNCENKRFDKSEGSHRSPWHCRMLSLVSSIFNPLYMVYAQLLCSGNSRPSVAIKRVRIAQVHPEYATLVVVHFDFNKFQFQQQQQFFFTLRCDI